MIVREAPIPGVKVIEPVIHRDERGLFLEPFRQDSIDQLLPGRTWVQENHSFTEEQGIIRGLHYQRPPAAQAKLIRVVEGKIFDVVVDLRKDSPTFGAWFGVELDGFRHHQLLVPEGLAHGFLTMSACTHVLYRVSAYYSPRNEGGLRWDDPAVGIEWPVVAERMRSNSRDSSWPHFHDLASQL